MMSLWWHEQTRNPEAELTTEQQVALVRQELELLERRISFIEATIAAVRADPDTEDRP